MDAGICVRGAAARAPTEDEFGGLKLRESHWWQLFGVSIILKCMFYSRTRAEIMIDALL